MSEQARAPTFDAQADALAHVTRRRLLYALAVSDGEIDVEESSPDIVDPDQTVALHHSHLPKLEALGYVSRDQQGIRRGPRFEEIQPLLELLDDHSEELAADWL